METPLVTGAPFPIPLPVEYEFDPRGGPIATYASKLDNPSVPAFISTLQSAGLKFTTSTPEGSATTIVRWSTPDPAGGVIPNPDTVISDIYELVGNNIQKSLWELPRIRAELFKFLNDSRGYSKTAYVRRIVEGVLSGAESTKDHEGNDAILSTDESVTNAFTTLGLNPDEFKGLIRSLSAGVETFPMAHFVLSRTRKLPAITNLKPSIALSNAIFTYDTLISLLNPPATITFSIPVGYWQYQTPSMTQQEDGTWRLSEEFWWADSFDPFVYGNFAY